MSDVTEPQAADASPGPAGVYRHDRQHVKRQVQRTGREPPQEAMERVLQTFAKVLLFPRTRFPTSFPRVELLLELQGSFTLVAEHDDRWPGRDVEIEREIVATGSWQRSGGEVELRAAVVYGFDVLPTAASHCTLGFHDGALWVELGSQEGFEWSLRFESLKPQP